MTFLIDVLQRVGEIIFPLSWLTQVLYKNYVHQTSANHSADMSGYTREKIRNLINWGLTHGQKFFIWMIIPVKNNSNDEFAFRSWCACAHIIFCAPPPPPWKSWIHPWKCSHESVDSDTDKQQFSRCRIPFFTNHSQWLTTIMISTHAPIVCAMCTPFVAVPLFLTRMQIFSKLAASLLTSL